MQHKRFIIALIFVLFLSTHIFASTQYIASVIRTPFHFITCMWAQKIDPSNAVYYSTREEAIKDGHRPCKVCKP
jgi:micrococcal nuclease